MNLNHFYHYYKSKSGGVSNLLKATEDFDSSIDWNKLPSTDAPTVSGGITDPNGGSDAQRINFTDNRQARVQQRVSLSASTQYTFSVYARVNTGTQQFRLRNVTLGEAEAKTATTSWTRFEYTFTTTTGGNYDLSIQNSSNDARTVEFWGAMLNVGASANDYVKVDPSISGSTPTPAYSGFGDTYGDVTAYYSLRKFTEAETLNAIRVRRSSDDTEQDIGFDANGDLDTTALTTFVNAEHTIADEDFSSSTGWTLGTGVSIADGVMSFLNSSSSSSAYKNFGATDAVGTKIRVSFTISNYSGSGTIRFIKYGATFLETSNQGGTQRSANGTYTEELTFSSFTSNLNWGLWTSGNFTGDIDDFEVLQITADGAVTTFYDQSGNGNNATNATESEQPLIVDGGSVAQFDGINSIEFDGTSHELAASLSLSTTAFSSFSVAGTDGVAGTNAQAIFGSNSTAFYSQIKSYDLETRVSSSPVLTLDDDIGNNPNQMQLFASINGTSQGNQYIDGTIGNRSPLDTSTSGGISETTVYIGSANGQRYLGGGICEIILFASDQSSNRTGMETNINDHFSIYP